MEQETTEELSAASEQTTDRNADLSNAAHFDNSETANDDTTNASTLAVPPDEDNVAAALPVDAENDNEEHINMEEDAPNDLADPVDGVMADLNEMHNLLNDDPPLLMNLEMNVLPANAIDSDDNSSISSATTNNSQPDMYYADLFSPNVRPDVRNNFMQRLRRAIFSIDHDGRLLRQIVPEVLRSESVDESAVDDIDQNMQDNIASPANVAALARAVAAAEEQEEQPHENAVRFDTNLPAEHAYLGTNMNRVSGVNYLDVGQQHRIMLFLHEHVLFPGEVLPFMRPGSFLEGHIDTQNGLLFGVCFTFLPANELDDTLYGVTCQIYEKGTDERGNTLIKSRALQRFVTKRSNFSGTLQYISSNTQFKCYGYVKILPEIYLPEPLKCIDMGCMQRFRDNDSMKHMYKRFQASSTPWPAHVYDIYSIEAIVEQARDRLAQHKIDTMPTDPIQLSFWLVRNLHLSEAMMKNTFFTDSVNIRMKLIASTFKEKAIFICRFCTSHVADCRELFAMSKHGVQSQYCNSAGYIHETNTVYQVKRDAISYNGEPSTEFSWFPGYQWQIIICRICSRHLGWEFKAVEPNLSPKIFYGISSSNVRVSNTANTDINPRDVIYRIMRMARPSFLR